MMRRTVPWFLLLGGLACAAPAVPGGATLKPGNPETNGFSTARLALLDSALNRWVENGDIAGAVGLIARDGKIVYYRATGYNDLGARTPLAVDGIFRIASQTKAITSVAAMMLWEEGKFLLDDPVLQYIPAFKGQRVIEKSSRGDETLVPAKRPVTVRDLLTHTAGIAYPNGSVRAHYEKQGLTAASTFGAGYPGKTLSDVIPRLATAPLVHHPGAEWTYGYAVDVLGYLVEIWSGMSLDEFFQRRIFEPLGMHDTYFNVPAEKAGRLVNFFRADSAGNLTQETVLRFPWGTDTLALSYPLESKTYFGGGGGLSSTVMDYAVFLQMLLNGGEYNGARLLSPNTVRMMTVNQIGDLTSDRFGTRFGFGFSVASDASFGHRPAPPGTFAWGGALGTTYWVDPGKKIVALLYRQMWGGDRAGIGERFPILVYQALTE